MGAPTVEAECDAEDIMALGRMVSYACQRAQSMKLEFSTYCLELALTALIQDLEKAGVAGMAIERSAADTPRSGFH